MSVVALALGAVLMMTAVVVGAAGQVVAARHRAEASADQSALAAAGAALHAGSAAACARAGLVSNAHGTRLVRCEVQPDLTVRVEVTEQLPPRLATLTGATSVRGRARAGP